MSFFQSARNTLVRPLRRLIPKNRPPAYFSPDVAARADKIVTAVTNGAPLTHTILSNKNTTKEIEFLRNVLGLVPKEPFIRRKTICFTDAPPERDPRPASFVCGGGVNAIIHAIEWTRKHPHDPAVFISDPCPSSTGRAIRPFLSNSTSGFHIHVDYPSGGDQRDRAGFHGPTLLFRLWPAHWTKMDGPVVRFGHVLDFLNPHVLRFGISAVFKTYSDNRPSLRASAGKGWLKYSEVFPHVVSGRTLLAITQRQQKDFSSEFNSDSNSTPHRSFDQHPNVLQEIARRKDGYLPPGFSNSLICQAERDGVQIMPGTLTGGTVSKNAIQTVTVKTPDGTKNIRARHVVLSAGPHTEVIHRKGVFMNNYIYPRKHFCVLGVQIIAKIKINGSNISADIPGAIACGGIHITRLDNVGNNTIIAASGGAKVHTPYRDPPTFPDDEVKKIIAVILTIFSQDTSHITISIMSINVGGRGVNAGGKAPKTSSLTNLSNFSGGGFGGNALSFAPATGVNDGA